MFFSLSFLILLGALRIPNMLQLLLKPYADCYVGQTESRDYEYVETTQLCLM